MASVQELGNNKYRIIVSDGFLPNGKRKRTTKTITARTKTEAKKIAAELEVGFREHKVSDKDNWTFTELIEEWRIVERNKLSQKTVSRYEEIINNSLLQVFGKKKVKQITTIDINRYIASLREKGIRKDGRAMGYSEQTQKHYYSLLRNLLNKAVKWEIIKENPCKNVDVPKVEKKETRHYEEEELKKLLELLDDQPIKYRLFIHLALFSGARRSEVLGLEWKDCDFQQGIIKIRRGSHDVRGIGVTTKEKLKTSSSRRIIALPKGTIKLLKNYQLEQNKQREDMGDKWIDHDRIFTQSDGKPMYPSTPYNWLKKFLKKNKLKHINIHELRHTHVSMLINDGMNIVAVSKRVGHADINTTLKIYTHLMGNPDYEGAIKLEKFYENTAI